MNEMLAEYAFRSEHRETVRIAEQICALLPDTGRRPQRFNVRVFLRNLFAAPLFAKPISVH